MTNESGLIYIQTRIIENDDAIGFEKEMNALLSDLHRNDDVVLEVHIELPKTALGKYIASVVYEPFDAEEEDNE